MQHSRRRVPARAWASGRCRLEDDLGEALAIAEVDEDGAAMVAAVLDPAEQDDGLADVAGGELATGVSALDLGDERNGHGGGGT
jgi:hypothetical protein